MDPETDRNELDGMEKQKQLKIVKKRIKDRKEIIMAEQMEEQKEKLPYWIHEKIDDEESVTGFYYLPQCHCSKCGHLSSYEKTVCPHCRSRMDLNKSQ